MREPGTAPPPSERRGSPPAARRSLLRFGTWGWGTTLLLGGIVLIFVVVGALWLDPGRNPAPAAYVDGVCRTFDHLGEAEAALGEALAAAEANDDEAAQAAADRAEQAVLAATHASAVMPDWPSGEPLNRLIAEVVVTSLAAVDQLREDEGRAADVAAEHERLRQRLATGRSYLAERRFGFGCDA